MVRELVEVHVRTRRAVHEPPDGGTDGTGSDVSSDSHVAEEEPSGDEAFIGAPRGLVHDVQIGRVEAESGGRQTVSNQVDPQELDRDQSLGKTQGGGQENRNDLPAKKRNHQHQCRYLITSIFFWETHF